ncbi:MAG: GDP-mannose 4,6-dehydratase [Anaerolineae bacterium]|nr:GDP-mannose 4,6-dehydratase [Anaerolineae bacterium]
MSTQTTLVTGGAGFIGSHLVDALLARGERVICLDNFTDNYSPERKRANIVKHLDHPDYTLVVGDIRDRGLVKQVFDKHQPQRVAHLAALAGVRASIGQATLYTEVNLQGSINLMDAARHFGVDNFIQASTSSVYGATDHIPFQENQPTDQPLAPYPATKKACEVMAHAYHNMFGLNITVLRFFTVYGPRVRSDMMAYMVMDSIIKDEEIIVYNEGSLHRDWTYVDDIIQGVVAALDKPFGYDVFNIGRGEPVRLGDFIDIIQELVGKPARIKHAPAPASEPPITYASIEKASQVFGYQPHTSIREGLAHTWKWYQEMEANNKSSD